MIIDIKNFALTFFVGAALLLAFLLILFASAQRAEAQTSFYPPTVDTVNATLSGDQNTLTYSASGSGACADDIDPETYCARSEYVDLALNFDIQRIVNNAPGGNQWNGYIYYPNQTSIWFFEGYPNPAQRVPAGLTDTLDVSAWPSGTYRLCVTVEGSVTALWPDDVYGQQSRCSGTFTIARGPSFTCSVTQTSATVDPGSDHGFTINTTPQGGFSSPVTFSATLSPSSGTPPVMSFTNNGQTPPGTTTGMASTVLTTTPGTYSIMFTGTGGGLSASCNTQLIVNQPAPNFELTISPTSRAVNIGNNAAFTVVAVCTGGFAGPITNLTARTSFTGLPDPTLGATSLACGASTTVTLTNTASVAAGEQSTILNTLLHSIDVTGSGDL